jgi:hypothetical protein
MCDTEAPGFLVCGEERRKWRYIAEARGVVNGVIGV